MSQASKYVNKLTLFENHMKDKNVAWDVFEKELEAMLNEGEISSGFDQNHICLVS